MPSRILSDREVEQLASWPEEVARSDLAAFFTLSLEDLWWVRSFRSPHAKPDRLGLAVQLRALPFLGFIPALAAAHTEIVDELVRLFDQALAGTDSRARGRLAVRQA